MADARPLDWLTTLARDSLGDFELTPEIDADLSRRAISARDHRAERDALFHLLALKANRFCARFWRWRLSPWEIDDVRQEAFLAFVDVLTAWRPIEADGGPAGFGYYFMRSYPLRLTDRVQRLVGTRRGRPAATAWTERIDDRLDPAEMERDIETLAFISALSAQLDATDARILFVRGSDGTIAELASRAGVSRRTFYRRWNR
ncbi:MAG: hypothetical protein ACRD1H_10035, partial [Vicinamibacterales bacterium]